jgi:hypothetical protein
MTDRELLEDAAKAAGLEYNGLWFDEQTGLLVWEPPTNYESRDWNPITDSGQALELAVKLRIIHRNPPSMSEYIRASGAIWTSRECWTRKICADEPIKGDPLAATRRAIVRVAAEIGRQKRAPDTQGSTGTHPIRRNPANWELDSTHNASGCPAPHALS